MRRFPIVLSFALFAAPPAGAQVGTIETVAGGGPHDLPAVEANLGDPTGIAVDAAGNLYIADWAGHRVYKVDPSGLLTVFAGTGTPSFSGDGGPAASAELRGPFGLALDANGNLFIADQINNRIRRVDASTGIITTVAGNGTFGFSGDGGPATAARFRSPAAVALDANGNLFIGDSSNHRVRRVDAATGVITTVAATAPRAPAVTAVRPSTPGCAPPWGWRWPPTATSSSRRAETASTSCAGSTPRPASSRRCLACPPIWAG